MRKIGFVIFAVAVMVGIMFANFVSWGKAEGKIFHFSVDLGGEKGSGTVRSEARDISDFSSIDVGGVFQVELTAQKDFAVEVEADDNLLQYVKTEVRGGKLEISMEKRVSTKNPIKVRISAPNIESIEASGASSVKAVNLKNTELGIDTSGASRVELLGEAERLNVEVSGASRINAKDLQTVNADVDASGASYVELSVSGSLSSKSSGASRIVYKGTPTSVEKKTSGAGSITQE